MDLTTFAIILTLGLAFANGTNDVSKAIATLVGSGITNYQSAIWWGTIWTIAGALVSGIIATALVKTFSQSLINPSVNIPSSLILSVLFGTASWVLLASRMGLPVSTTHALTGSIVGAGVMALGNGGLVWENITNKIVLPLLVSPLLAFGLCILFHTFLRHVVRDWKESCLCILPSSRALIRIDSTGATRTVFQTSALGQPIMAVPAQCDRAGLKGWTFGVDTIHWISSGLASFARGTNDAPKIVAILLLGETLSSWSLTSLLLAFTAVAFAMGLGGYIGGLRVTEALAENVTPMDHSEGLSANLATSSIVLTAATIGLPVSTTHVSSSAIIGIGLLKNWRTIQWSTVRDIVLAWMITLPGAALLACMAQSFLMTLL